MSDDTSDLKFPALYEAASGASMRAQRSYRVEVAFYLSFLVVGALCSLLSNHTPILGIIGAIVFLSGLALSIYSAFKRHDRVWYNGRAVAESVKTSSWRFMMRAEPFALENESEVAVKFRSLLKKILEQNRSMASFLLDSPAAEGVPRRMLEIRSLPVAERVGIYHAYRIADQRSWYQSKATQNSAAARKWFLVLVLFHSSAIVCMFIKIKNPSWDLVPVSVFATAAGAVLTWMQFGKFTDLAAAYNLTSHEIAILESELEGVHTEEDFALFVKDAEGAFSREHTQWVARKDS